MPTSLYGRPSSWRTNSANHLIRLEEDHGRQREPEGLRGLEVDDELEPHRLLHRQVGWPGTVQDFIYVGGNALPPVPVAGAIAHEGSVSVELMSLVKPLIFAQESEGDQLN